MANGRCRWHGGCSTGARTPEGLERARRASWKHGQRSAAALAANRAVRELRRAVDALDDAVLRGGDSMAAIDRYVAAQAAVDAAVATSQPKPRPKT
jgi:hypothetical protein